MINIQQKEDFKMKRFVIKWICKIFNITVQFKDDEANLPDEDELLEKINNTTNLLLKAEYIKELEEFRRNNV
jgi:hypothetical protein